jgi:hypothetical protein
LGNLGVQGDGAVIPGVAACGVGVEATGIVDSIRAGSKGAACRGRETGAVAGGTVGGTD